MTTVYLKATAITDSQSNVASGTVADIDEGVDGGTPDGSTITSVTNGWSGGPGTGSAILIDVDNVPGDYGSYTSALVRTRAQVLGGWVDDSWGITCDVIGTNTPSGTVAYSIADDGSGFIERATAADSGNAPSSSDIDGWQIRIYQASWSAEKSADGLYFDLDGVEIELVYTASANITRSPGAGSGTLSGSIPTVVRTENHVIPVGVGTLTATGNAPTLQFNFNIAVPVGSLTLTGLAPSVEITLNVAPGTGTATLTGEIPTLNVTDNHIRAPPVGSLTLTGLVPTVERSWVIEPPVGSLSLSGKIPSIDITVLRLPGKGSLALTGYAPIVEITHIREPGVGLLTLSGQIPALVTAFDIPVGKGSLSLSGSIPTVTVGAVSASAVITGTASDGMTETEVVGGQSNLLKEDGGNLLKEDGGLLLIGGETIIITLTGDTWVATASFDAQRQAIINGLDSAQSETFGWNNEVRDKLDVSRAIRTSDTVVTITLGPHPAYDITVDEVVEVTVPASALTGAVALIATPTFTITADIAVSGGRIRRRRYVVEIDGQFFDAASPEHAIEILEQAAEIVEETPQIKQPIVKVKTITGKVSKSKVIQKAIKRTQRRINQALERQRQRFEIDREISILLQAKFRQEDDDEEAVMLLLL